MRKVRTRTSQEVKKVAAPMLQSEPRHSLLSSGVTPVARKSRDANRDVRAERQGNPQGLVPKETPGVQRQNSYPRARPRHDFTVGECRLRPVATSVLDKWLSLLQSRTEFGLQTRPYVDTPQKCGVLAFYTIKSFGFLKMGGYTNDICQFNFL